MFYSKYQVVILLGVLFTGIIISVLKTTLHRIEARGTNNDLHLFNHPVFELFLMTLSEMMCMGYYWLIYLYCKRKGTLDTNIITRGNTHFNHFLIIVPAFLDVIATGLLHCLMVFKYPGTTYFLRGLLVIMVATLGTFYLKTDYSQNKWYGMVAMSTGSCLVGVGDFLAARDEGQFVELCGIGTVVLVSSQICRAIQIIYEEKIMVKYDIPPLYGVGWEGIFGSVIAGLMMIASYFIDIGDRSFNPRHVLEDGVDIYFQIANKVIIVPLTILLLVFVSFFNYFMQSVTKELHGGTAMVFYDFKTSIMWLFNLIVFGQQFDYVPLAGFVIQLLGTCIFCDLFVPENVNNILNLGQQPRPRRVTEDPAANLEDRKSLPSPQKEDANKQPVPQKVEVTKKIAQKD